MFASQFSNQSLIPCNGEVHISLPKDHKRENRCGYLDELLHLVVPGVLVAVVEEWSISCVWTGLSDTLCLMNRRKFRPVVPGTKSSSPEPSD